MNIPKVMGTEIEYGIYVGDGNDKETSRVSESSDQEKFFIAIKRMIEDCPSRFVLFPDSQRKSGFGFRFIRIPHGNILSNGGRFYRDHLHPELSTPECLSARDLVIWEKAGERIVEESRKKALASLGIPIIIFKDSCDRKGSSFGAHENYLLSSKTFRELIEAKGEIAQAWVSFLVTRQIWAGAGKVAQFSEGEFGYQISQRADFIRGIVHFDTMVYRSIINSRDCPYANPEKFRRLHVIVGEANMSEYALWLKVGLSALLLEMLEEGFVPEDLPVLKNPVLAIREISKDLTLKKTLELVDGRQMTAIGVQKWFADWFSNWYSSFYVPNKGRNLYLEELLRECHYTTDTLENDPTKLADRLDWLIKLKILRDYMAKYRLSWDNWRVRATDMAYHNTEKEKSIFYRLEKKGKTKRMVTDEEIERAMVEPPTNTRAYFRSFCFKKFPEKIINADWDRIGFKGPRISPLDDTVIDYITPFWGTKEDCKDLKSVNFKEFKKILKDERNLRLRRRLL